VKNFGEEGSRLFAGAEGACHRALTKARIASPERALRHPHYLTNKNLSGLLMSVSTEHLLEAPAVGWSRHLARFFVEHHALPRCSEGDLRRAP
jgi:hypothetical protein